MLKFFIKNDVRPLIHLALPLALVSMVQSLIGFFETLFFAHLDMHVLAAGALVGWLFATLVVIQFGMLGSVNILIAHHHGAKDEASIAKVLRDGLVLALLAVLPTFALLWNMAPILIVFGQSQSVVGLATAYLHPLAWALLPTFVMTVFMQLLIGLGHTRVIMVFTVLSVPLTIALSYLFIFGALGFPSLKIAGAGWGIMISNSIEMLAIIVYLTTQARYKKYLTALFQWTKTEYLIELLQLGLPMGLMFCLEVGFFFVLMLCMGRISVQALAANQLVFQYFCFCMNIAFALAQAITVRMGHALGASNHLAAKRASYTGVVMIFVIMLIIALGYWCIPRQLMALDIDIHRPQNQALIATAIPFFAVAAIFQLFEAVRITLFGALRALKDTRFTLLTSIMSFWCVALPLGYGLAFIGHWGGIGFWWAMVFGGVLSVILLLYRLARVFNQKKWMRQGV